MTTDRILRCKDHGLFTHTYRPSPEAGPYWRCSECGESCEDMVSLSGALHPRALELADALEQEWFEILRSHDIKLPLRILIATELDQLFHERDALKARIAELETAEAKRQQGYAKLQESDAWKHLEGDVQTIVKGKTK